MAINLEQLRKHYNRLTAYERAAMQTEAARLMDEDLFDVLQPQTLKDAYRTVSYWEIFLVLGLLALHESQRADSAYLACMAGKLLVDREEAEKQPQAKMSRAQKDRFILYVQEIREFERRRAAWILALKALDDELAAGFISCLRLFANDYLDQVLEETTELQDVDFSVELSTLRHLWRISSQNKPDAPKAGDEPRIQYNDEEGEEDEYQLQEEE